MKVTTLAEPYSPLLKREAASHVPNRELHHGGLTESSLALGHSEVLKASTVNERVIWTSGKPHRNDTEVGEDDPVGVLDDPISCYIITAPSALASPLARATTPIDVRRR